MAMTSGSRCMGPRHNVEIATEAGFARAPAKHFFLERYAEAYRREMAHFVEAVTSGNAPQPTGHDGLQAQAIADAAARSLETGQPVVLDGA